MCRSKDDPRGPMRCAAHGAPGHGSTPQSHPLTPLPASPALPAMPDDYQPSLGKLMAGWVRGGKVRLGPAERRVYWYREVVGYGGWLNEDGYPCRGVQ